MQLVLLESCAAAHRGIAHIPELFKIDSKTARRLICFNELHSFTHCGFKENFFSNRKTICALRTKVLFVNVQRKGSIKHYVENFGKTDRIRVK